MNPAHYHSNLYAFPDSALPDYMLRPPPPLFTSGPFQATWLTAACTAAAALPRAEIIRIFG